MAVKDPNPTAPAGGVTPTTAKAPAPRATFNADREGQAVARLDATLVVVVLAFAFLLASFAVRNSDFFMHAATGREIVQGNLSVLFGTDPFSHTTEATATTPATYWVNHSWLYDVFLYAGYTMFGEDVGGPLVVVVKGLVVVGIAVGMLAFRRPGQSLWVPAAVTALAMLAMSPRLYLQPVVLSFLFLVLTLLILHKYRANRGLWLLVPLFVMWVNLDAWFFLGPITVTLWLLGEGITSVFSGGGPRTKKAMKEAKETEPAPSLSSLALVLVAATAACVLNPHHVWAFSTLPVEVTFAPYAEELARQRVFESIFYSPLNWSYYRSPIGGHAAGWSFFALVGVGLLSFLLDTRNLSWPRLLVWLAFAGLTLWRAQCVGFFAAVSAPLAILNFQDLAARANPTPAPLPRLDRNQALKSLGLVALVFVVFAVIVKTSLISLVIDAVTRAYYPNVQNVSQTLRLPDPPITFLIFLVFLLTCLFFTVGPLLSYLSDALGRWRVAGRLLTVVAALALLALAWPGWLGPDWDNPYYARRADWAVEPDPSLKGVALKLDEWRREERLPADARGFNLFPGLNNYLAWYAPGQKGFFDQRYPLFADVAPAYLEVRDLITSDDLSYLQLQPGPDGRIPEADRKKRDEVVRRVEELEKQFRERNIRYVVLTSEVRRDSQRAVQSAMYLMVMGPWQLLDLDGRSLILSWTDPLNKPTADAGYLVAQGCGTLTAAAAGVPLGGLAQSCYTVLPATYVEELAPDPLRGVRFKWDTRAFAMNDGGTDPAEADACPQGPAPLYDPAHFMIPPKPRQLGTELAQMYLDFFRVIAGARTVNRGQVLAQAWREGVVPLSTLMAVSPDGGPVVTGTLLLCRAPGPLSNLQASSIVNTYSVDANEPGLALLGIRAARQAQNANPEDPECYLRLGLLYGELSGRTRERHWNLRGTEYNTRLLANQGVASQMMGSMRMMPELSDLRRVQITAAVQQGVALASDSSEAHAMLAQVFQESNIHDLYVTHQTKALQLRQTEFTAKQDELISRRQELEQKLTDQNFDVELKRKGLTNTAENRRAVEDSIKKEIALFKEAVDQIGKELDQIPRQIESLSAALKKRQEDYAQVASQLKRQVQKAGLAREFGLLDRALEILRPLRDEGEPDPMVTRMMLELLLETGQLTELTQWYCGPDRRLKPELRGGVLGMRELSSRWAVPADEWYSLMVAAGLGDYAEADRALKRMVEEIDTAQDPNIPEPLRLITLAIGDVMRDRLHPCSFANALRSEAKPRPIPYAGELIAEAGVRIYVRADLMSLRGLLALEAGKTREARGHFKEALPAMVSPDADELTGSQEVAQYYLELFDRAGR